MSRYDETRQDIVVPHELGPAMRELTEMQRSFVVGYLDYGGRPGKAPDAARDAGYSTHNDNVLKSNASRLLHMPKIIRAIKEEADLRLRTGAILGASVLIEIAGDANHKKQYNAAVELLNRSDLIVAERKEIIVDDKRPGKDELVERVHSLAERLGIDPAMLLKGQTLMVPATEMIDVTPNLGQDDDVSEEMEQEDEEW